MKEIRVLTWNICYGCMTNNPEDRTARQLAERCKTLSKKTKKPFACLDNVIQTIQDASRDRTFDFIALQEASNWKKIVRVFSNKMGHVHSKGGYEDMLTLFDKNRFHLLGFKAGDLSSGRPYQVLVFHDKENKKIIVFINLHNGHNVVKSQLQNSLSVKANKTTQKRSTSLWWMRSLWNNASDTHSTSTKPTKIQYIQDAEKRGDNVLEIIQKKNQDVCVIAAGDFNDHVPHQYWKGLNLKHIHQSTLSSNKTKPPKSCCSTSRQKNSVDPYYGDYILADMTKMKFVKNKNNHVAQHFNPEAIKKHWMMPDKIIFPTSDHKPIEATLRPI